MKNWKIPNGSSKEEHADNTLTIRNDQQVKQGKTNKSNKGRSTSQTREDQQVKQGKTNKSNKGRPTSQTREDQAKKPRCHIYYLPFDIHIQSNLP
jgi:hypothetical protein